MTQTSPQRNEGFQYAQSLRGIVERIAFQLSDVELGEEYAQFEESWLQARVIDTMKWLQGRKPSLFSTDKEITLEPGETHKRPEGCDKLFQITEVIDDKGNCHPVCEADYKDLQASRRLSHLMPRCMTNFPVYTFAFNPSNEEEYILTPASVKPLTVKVTCSDVSQFLEDPDKLITCEAAKYINMIVEYVLYQAMSIDSENVTIAALADRHRATFFDLAPIRAKSSNDRDS